MDFSWLSSILGLLEMIPAVGPILAKIMLYALPVSAVVYTRLMFTGMFSVPRILRLLSLLSAC